MASAHGALPNLLPPAYKRLISSWLEEDCPSFDYGGFVVGSHPATAHLYQKSPGKLAGVPFFDEVFAQLSCQVDWLVSEGSEVYNNNNDDTTTTTTTDDATTDHHNQPTTNGATPPTSPPKRIHIATVTGPANALLLGERVALNTLSRTSGIATRTASFLRLLSHHRSTTALAGTRKTTPGFRLPEKYGILIGGADPHRMDLSAMTMLKDNHIAARGGSIRDAVRAAKAVGGFAVKVEVECASEEAAGEAVEAGADVVMLDNFGAGEWAGVSRRLRERFSEEKGGGSSTQKKKFLIEVSGGLTEANLREGCLTGDIDVVSTSSIHQGVPHIDFSLKIVAGEAAT